MRPLTPPPVIFFGLALFVPRLAEHTDQTFNVDCQVFWTDSVEFGVDCRPGVRPIFQQSALMINDPVAFFFQTDGPLPAGKYDIRLVTRGNFTVRGARSLILPKERPNLVIGFPYSVYSPITLS